MQVPREVGMLLAASDLPRAMILHLLQQRMLDEGMNPESESDDFESGDDYDDSDEMDDAAHDSDEDDEQGSDDKSMSYDSSENGDDHKKNDTEGPGAHVGRT